MATKPTKQFGDFALFGFSQQPSGVLRKLTGLGISPQVIKFGAQGSFYFYTTFGSTVKTEAEIGLKLGYIRTPDITPLSTDNLLAQKLITPARIDQDALRGNALLGCFSKIVPEFSLYQSLFSTVPLYYTQTGSNILCSSSMPLLAALLDNPQVNEAAVPSLFLFQVVPGPLTLYKNVYRLFPGQQLHWRKGRLSVEYVKTLRFNDKAARFDRVDRRAVEFVYERISAIINAYLDDIGREDHSALNLLSGGVDSSIIQLILNERFPSPPEQKTVSYAVHVPGFEFEVDYARQASKLLGTGHILLDIWPDDLPDILTRAVKAAAQPVPGEPDACKIALAEFLAATTDAPRFYFAGQGADAVYGLGLGRKLAIFNIFRKLPAAQITLGAAALLAARRSKNIAHGLQEIVSTLSALDAPQAFDYWPNKVCIYTNLTIARRAFGDETLQKALAYRRQMEAQFLNSQNLLEQLHTIDLLTISYEPAVFSSQMFLSQKKEQIFPYLDEDILRLAAAFAPRIRYTKPGLGALNRHNTKYLLKQILLQKSYPSIAKKRKGGSVFDRDLFLLMKEGALRDMVHAIDRPGFLSRADFEALLQQPDYFLWTLLSYDIFQKQVLKTV